MQQDTPKSEQSKSSKRTYTSLSKPKTILLSKEQHKSIEENSESKLQAFQRKIYLKAKQNPKYKFYCLYDKVCRTDAIQEAYKRVKENNGAPGIDKQTFSDLEKNKQEEAFLSDIQQELINQIYTPERLREIKIPKTGSKTKTRTLKIPTIKDRVVQMAIKLIIEPIFEADFKENSYGYRPKKSAHQAITKLNNRLFPDIYKKPHQQKEICSIDLSDCFDTIPHHELIHLIAKRIIDKRLLKLIKTIIKAGAQKPEDKDKETGGKGTPQGGVLSPLLANIYLDRLDDFWETRDTKSLMLRYADDMVILLSKEDEATFQSFLDYTEQDLKLIVNKEKTSRNTIQQGFDFLGFTIRQKTSKNKKQCINIEPSKKSLNRIRDKLRHTINWRSPLSNEEVIDSVSSIIKGWHFYFDNIAMGKTRQKLKWYIEGKMGKFLTKRNKKRRATWKLFSTQKLYKELELYELRNLGRKFT